MYYCLKENCLLRGWEKLPTGIVENMTGRVLFTAPALYAKIRETPWMLFENSPFMTSDERSVMTALVEEGIAERSDTVKPLTQQQEYHRYPNRYVHSVHWAVTGRCNCRCRHCYMSAPSGKIPEYSTDECIDIIRQIEEAGIRAVSMTGGEALVRGDFMQLVRQLTKAGICIETIMSNGLLVNEELLVQLEDAGQKPEFNMSFDGIGCHDWLRGTDGAEEAVIRAFRLCQKHGFPTGAEYCLHKGNKHVFRESVNLLASLGCRSLKVNGLSSEGEALNIRDYFLPADEEYRFYLEYLPHFFEDGMPLDLMLGALFASSGKECVIPAEKLQEDGDCDNYCICAHARNQMHITADGFIVPCIPIGCVETGRNRFPNIRRTTIREALSDSAYMDFIDTRLKTYFKHNPKCASCEYRNRCAGGCRGNAAHGGDLLGRDEKSCMIFKNGWYARVQALIREHKN